MEIFSASLNTAHGDDWVCTLLAERDGIQLASVHVCDGSSVGQGSRFGARMAARAGARLVAREGFKVADLGMLNSDLLTRFVTLIKGEEVEEDITEEGIFEPEVLEQYHAEGEVPHEEIFWTTYLSVTVRKNLATGKIEASSTYFADGIIAAEYEDDVIEVFERQWPNGAPSVLDLAPGQKEKFLARYKREAPDAIVKEVVTRYAGGGIVDQQVRELSPAEAFDPVVVTYDQPERILRFLAGSDGLDRVKMLTGYRPSPFAAQQRPHPQPPQPQQEAPQLQPQPRWRWSLGRRSSAPVPAQLPAPQAAEPRKVPMIPIHSVITAYEAVSVVCGGIDEGHGSTLPDYLREKFVERDDDLTLGGVVL